MKDKYIEARKEQVRSKYEDRANLSRTAKCIIGGLIGLAGTYLATRKSTSGDRVALPGYAKKMAKMSQGSGRYQASYTGNDLDANENILLGSVSETEGNSYILVTSIATVRSTVSVAAPDVYTQQFIYFTGVTKYTCTPPESTDNAYYFKVNNTYTLDPALTIDVSNPVTYAYQNESYKNSVALYPYACTSATGSMTRTL